MSHNNEPKKDNFFCLYPFYHMDTTPYGNYRLCCNAEDEPISHKDLNHELWWNSDYLNQIRKSLIDGKKHEACKSCYKIESTGGVSKRLIKQETIDLGSINFINPKLKSIDIRMGNLCNAKCVICNPRYSSLIDKEYSTLFQDREKYSFVDIRNRAEESAGHSIESVSSEHFSSLESIYISGGEPSISPIIITILKKLSSDCHISFNTNLKVIDNDFWHELKRFESFSIGPSCDGTEDSFDYLRYPIKFNSFVKNINWVIENFPKASIFFNFTYSILNYNQINNVFKLAREFQTKHKSFELKFNILHGPNYLNINNFTHIEREPLIRDLSQFIKDNEVELNELRATESIRTLYSYLAEVEENQKRLENKWKARSFVDAISKNRNIKLPRLPLSF